MSMADNCEEGLYYTGDSLKMSPAILLCQTNDIAEENLKHCSSSFYNCDGVSATVDYFEDQNNGNTYAFFSFSDGSWGFSSD